MSEHQGRHRGFTAVELLVVIAVIAILMAILLPAILRARRSSVEMASVSQVIRMFDTLMYIRMQERGTLPSWREDKNLVIHSDLYLEPDKKHHRPEPLHGFDLKVFEDPFRLTYSIANDPLLARLGKFDDSEQGTDGRGYFYVPMTSSAVFPNLEESKYPANSIVHPMWDRRPRREWEEPSWTRMNLPADTEYLLWGVGQNGVLDGDPALDVVLVKTPDNEGLVRHRPVQPPGPGIGQASVDVGH